MNDKPIDVQQTLSYTRRASLHWRWLGLGLLCLAIGIGFSIWQPDDFRAYDWFMIALAFITGIFMTLYAAAALLLPVKPTFVLSPQGIRLHIEWVKDILIPWREVRGVETTDITGTFRGHLVHFPGVTVVAVSRDFYDRRIHVNNWILRGPGWDTNFVPKDSMVQIAFHHEALDASAEEMRAALEARWRAFGRAPAAASTS